jgi:predicted small lipoprotein YifL
MFVWCRRHGDFVVNRKLRPTPSGLAILLFGAAVFALAGCGRKGPLDLPPSASTPTAAAAAPAAPTDTEAESARRASVFNPNYGADAPPTAPRGSKKPFILDPLLGN